MRQPRGGYAQASGVSHLLSRCTQGHSFSVEGYDATSVGALGSDHRATFTVCGRPNSYLGVEFRQPNSPRQTAGRTPPSRRFGTPRG